MDPESIEGRLAGLCLRGSDAALRARVLGAAREAWGDRVSGRAALWRLVRGWAMAVAAVLVACGAISWREESLTARHMVSRPVSGDAREDVLRKVCSDVGLNHGYAARLALIVRARRGPAKGLAPSWREWVNQ